MSKTSSKNISTIIADVEICMDEIAINDAEFDGGTTTQDDSEREVIIKSKIVDALRFVYQNADASLLDPDEIVKGNEITVTSSNVGKYTIPSGYLRLCYAGFASWNRYVGQEDIILWNSKEYSKLKNTYATGTPDRPKIAIGWNSDGNKQFELYSAKDGTDTATIGYMTEPSLTDSSGTEQTSIDIDDKIYRAVIYYIAGLVFITYAEQTKANMMFSQANDLMGFTQMAAAQQQQVQQ